MKAKVPTAGQIYNARHMAGLNQTEAGVECGVSRVTFWKWENGHVGRIAPENVEALRAWIARVIAAAAEEVA